MIPVPVVAAACQAPDANVAKHWPVIVAELERLGIGQTLVQVAAAATVAVETGRFAPIKELRASRDRQPALWAQQEKYYPSGYYGRGFIQVTHRANYAAYGEKLGVDLVGDPDKALDPVVAAQVLALYFRERGVDQAALRKDWPKARKLVNGGFNGLERFSAVVRALLVAMGMEA